MAKFVDFCKCFLFIFLSVICLLTISLASLAATPEGIQVYQKKLSALHKQKLADDITRYRNADNIWDVLREEFTLPHYEKHPVVQEKIDWFMNNQDYLLRSATRAAPYLYYILQQVRKRHLPAELVLLPIVESGYNPFSLSNMGAAGIWQLMPETATGLGIKQDSWYDGRRDIIASTRGALNHLAYLQNFFEGNWLLAIAAYNTGEGNVLAAIKRNIRDGRSTDFWSLPVAQQTKDYVPSILALATIISRPDIYPLYFPPVRNAPYLAQVDIGRQINLKLAAALAGLSHKTLLQLNPGYNHNHTAKGPYKLVLPIENIEQFSENLARSPFNHDAKWFHYKVRKNDNLASIAKRFNTSAIDIRKMNHLVDNNLKPGTHLLVPTTQFHDKVVNPKPDNKRPIIKPLLAAKTVKTTTTTTTVITKTGSNQNNEAATKKTNNVLYNYALQPGDTIYMIRDTDTLTAVAKRFKVNGKFLLAINQLKQADIKPGKQIIIPTHHQNNGFSEGDTIYVVRRGDTLEKIAQKYKTSAAAIRLANLIDNNALLEGEKIVVPTHFTG